MFPFAKRRTVISAGVLAAILILASVRFVGLGQESFWLDEAKGAAFAFSPLSEWVQHLPEHHAPPGHFLVLRMWGAVGVEDGWLRLPSAIAGVLSAGAVWFLLRKIDPLSAFCAALMLATAPFHLHFSGEARCYALWGLVDLVSLCCLFAWRSDPEDRKKAGRCGFLLPLPLLLHYNALWFLAARAPLVAGMLRKKGSATRRSFLLPFGISSLLCFPWLVWQMVALPPENARARTEWGDLGPAFWTRKFNEFFGFEGFPYSEVFAMLFGLAILIGLGARSFSRRRFDRCWLCALLFPLVACVAASIATDRYFAARHLFPLLPLFLWEAVRGARVCANVFGKRLATPAVVGWSLAFCFLWSYPTLRYGPNQIPDRPPWRDIAQTLQDRTPPSPILLVGDNVSVLDYYRHSRRHTFASENANSSFEGEPRWIDPEIGAILVSGAENGGRAWRSALVAAGLQPSRTWRSDRIDRIDLFDVSKVSVWITPEAAD